MNWERKLSGANGMHLLALNLDGDDGIRSASNTKNV
jgi:hypothetical protein